MARSYRPTQLMKLVKLHTDDELLEVNDCVPLGTRYLVYADPIQMDGLHRPTGTLWTRTMYECVEGGWLPAEMLEVTRDD